MMPVGSQHGREKSVGLFNRFLTAPGWLSSEQQVTQIQTKRLGEGYGYTTVITLFTFTFSDGVPDIVPRTVVAKLPSEGFDPSSPASVFLGSMYKTEERFFGLYASTLFRRTQLLSFF
jgi:hypothetical protein